MLSTGSVLSTGSGSWGRKLASEARWNVRQVGGGDASVLVYGLFGVGLEWFTAGVGCV